jgi:glucose-1-phosphate thymidylyltransferase
LYSGGMPSILRSFSAVLIDGAAVFGFWVEDPERSGVVEFDAHGRAVSLEEKPLRPKSAYAVTGFYFFDNLVSKIASKLTPSACGELEITDVNLQYLSRQRLRLDKFGRGNRLARYTAPQ